MPAPGGYRGMLSTPSTTVWTAERSRERPLSMGETGLSQNRRLEQSPTLLARNTPDPGHVFRQLDHPGPISYPGRDTLSSILHGLVIYLWYIPRIPRPG